MPKVISEPLKCCCVREEYGTKAEVPVCEEASWRRASSPEPGPGRRSRREAVSFQAAVRADGGSTDPDYAE